MNDFTLSAVRIVIVRPASRRRTSSELPVARLPNDDGPIPVCAKKVLISRNRGACVSMTHIITPLRRRRQVPSNEDGQKILRPVLPQCNMLDYAPSLERAAENRHQSEREIVTGDLARCRAGAGVSTQCIYRGERADRREPYGDRDGPWLVNFGDRRRQPD